MKVNEEKFRIVKFYDRYIVQIKVFETEKYGGDLCWYGVSIDFKTGTHKDIIAQYYLCGFKRLDKAYNFKVDLESITTKENFTIYTDQRIKQLI